MTTPLSETAIRPLADVAAREAGIPTWLVLAVARHESAGFYPDARRDEAHLADASHGLMQLLLATARAHGFSGDPGRWNEATRTGTGLYDPLTNLRLGAKHLKALLTATGNDYERAVSAYNAGLGNAKKATTTTRFCDLWKPTAPKVGRTLDRDCARIRTVLPGEWLNQPYVTAINRYAQQFGGSLKPSSGSVGTVAPDSVGSGGGSRPAGDSSSGPLPSPSSGSSVFVVRSALAIALAAVGTILWLALRK